MTHVFLFLLDVDPADTPAPVGDQAISSRGDPEGRRIDGHRRTAAQHLDIQVTEQLDQSDRPVRPTDRPTDLFPLRTSSHLMNHASRFEAEREINKMKERKRKNNERTKKTERQRKERWRRRTEGTYPGTAL